MQKTIENCLQTSLGFAVPVCLRTVEQLETLLQHNPFIRITVTPDTRFAIVFLAQPSSVTLPIPFLTPDGGYEVIGRTDTELFVVWRLVNGRPGNSYGLIERKLQVATTTRFWHTAGKILTAAKNV